LLSFLNTSRIWIIVLGLIALLLAALIARDIFVPSTPTASQVRTATVAEGTVRSSVTGTGSVEPAQQLNVGFKTAGQLIEVDVHAGDHVAAGQLLARIDPTSAQQALEQAQANLQSALARLTADSTPVSADQLAQLQHQVAAARTNYNDTVAQVNFTNTQDANNVQADQNQYNVDQCTVASNSRTVPCTTDLAKLQQDQVKQQQDQISGQTQVHKASQAITQAQDALNSATDVKPGSIAADQASVASAQAEVDNANTAVNQTTLTSPMAGYVVSVTGQPGESVGASGGATATAPGSTAPQPSSASTSSNGTGSGASSFITLSSDSAFQAVVPFAETDAARLQPNQTASATFDAINGLSLPAHVLAVSVTATVISNVVNYYATFTFDDSDRRLKAGMTANLTVVVDEADNVLVVPTSAITRRGQAATVTVLQTDGTHVITPIETGVVGDSTTEVTSGLKAGDKVLLPTLNSSTRTGGGGVVFGGGRGPGGG
jgi:HlyD family secretion protein